MSANQQIILDSCVEKLTKEHFPSGMDDSDLFEIFTVLQITKDVDLDIDEIQHSIVDKGQDGGIDSFIILYNDRYIYTPDQLKDLNLLNNSIIKIYIIQVKREITFKEDAFDKLNTSLPIILNYSIEEKALFERFNPRLVEKIIILRNIWREAVIHNCEIKLIFSYVCRAQDIQINKSIKSKMQQVIKVARDNLEGAKVEFNLYSSKELLSLYKKQKTTTLNLKLKEQPISVKFANDKYGYIGFATLSDYYNFIVDEEKNVREYIFEDNVRYFQGNIELNRKIEDTVRNDHDRDFWWLNNGITIIASQCRSLHKELCLTDVKIVNGLQTSFVIARALEKTKDSDERSLLVKVIVAEDKETIDKIIAATNSQTAVSPILLRATDDVQRNIELFFATHGYYYDRRKNYYRSRGISIRKIFSIQYAAQAIEAILNFDPARARSNPTAIMSDDKSYKKIFDPKNDYKVYLNCCLICRKVHDYIKSLPQKNRGAWENFALHITRILASILINKEKYGPVDIVNINVDNINDNIIRRAHGLLKNELIKYIKKNPDLNVINIAKAKKFGIAVDSRLKELFDKNTK